MDVTWVQRVNVSSDTVQPLPHPSCFVQVMLDDPHLRGGDMFRHRQEGVTGSTCVDAQLKPRLASFSYCLAGHQGP